MENNRGIILQRNINLVLENDRYPRITVFCSQLLKLQQLEQTVNLAINVNVKHAYCSMNQMKRKILNS